jgi:hypothetical protein
MFVVDVKREDGSCIEVFLSGDGDELGWLRVDESLEKESHLKNLLLSQRQTLKRLLWRHSTGLVKSPRVKFLGS